MINSHAAEAPEFVGAFIAYLDGEKDPRNLMLVFSILQVPATEWPLGDNAQVILAIPLQIHALNVTGTIRFCI